MSKIRVDIKRTRYSGIPFNNGERVVEYSQNVLITSRGDCWIVGLDIEKGDIVNRRLVQTLNRTLKKEGLSTIKCQKLDNHGVSFNLHIVLERLDERISDNQSRYIGQISQLKDIIRRREERIDKLESVCKEYKVPSTCTECNGTGNMLVEEPLSGEWENCDACDGDGRIK